MSCADECKPQRLWRGIVPVKGHNSFGVAAHARSLPRVARSSQPWAGGLNPFGIGNFYQVKLAGISIRKYLADVAATLGARLTTIEQSISHTAADLIT